MILNFFQHNVESIRTHTRTNVMGKVTWNPFSECIHLHFVVWNSLTDMRSQQNEAAAKHIVNEKRKWTKNAEHKLCIVEWCKRSTTNFSRKLFIQSTNRRGWRDYPNMYTHFDRFCFVVNSQFIQHTSTYNTRSTPLVTNRAELWPQAKQVIDFKLLFGDFLTFFEGISVGISFLDVDATGLQESWRVNWIIFFVQMFFSHVPHSYW